MKTVGGTFENYFLIDMVSQLLDSTHSMHFLKRTALYTIMLIFKYCNKCKFYSGLSYLTRTISEILDFV